MSHKAQQDGRLLGQVRASFAGSAETYRARRTRHDLPPWGHRCGLHRIERLMRFAGLVVRKARRRKPYDSGSRHTIAANPLDRQLKAAGPNLKRAADFTYLWTHEGWLFVAVVIDLFSRRVVGWSARAHMRVQLVMDALMTAIWRRGAAGALFHSDQGSR